MRITELALQTHRQPPAHARSDGQAFLIRAGYLSHSGEWLPLGQTALQRLKTLAEHDPKFLSHLGLPLLGTSDRFYPIETGDTETLHCPVCGFAARLELAPIKKTVFSHEPPAPLERVLTPNCPTIENLAAFLGIPPEKTAKALMFVRPRDGQFIFVVLRGDHTLSSAKLTALVGETRLAEEAEIRAVGAVPGYASPIGVKNALIVVDDLIPRSPNLVAGANEAGYHLCNTNYGRDYTAHLVADLILAAPGAPCPECAAPLAFAKAWQMTSGKEYDWAHLLLALAETYHDEQGLTLPPAAAPFQVYLMHVPGKNLDTLSAAKELYRVLVNSGISVLFDDRDERAGVKFNDADLVGCPLRITVGERGLQNGAVEVKPRREGQNQTIPFEEVVAFVSKTLR
ncbi:MAG: YbaK/EbsC family protein [Anaerolineales bacterium]|nr:YbaK/EbsC family protein [Anaerolineales bacterium]